MTLPVGGIGPHQDTFTVGIVDYHGVEIGHETFDNTAASYVAAIDLLDARGVSCPRCLVTLIRGGYRIASMSDSYLGRDFSSTVWLSRVWLSLGLVFALTAALLMGLASPAGAVAGYGDVGEGTWYTDAAQWSVDNGITGIAGPCFGPKTPVSRGETAVWIYNMENQPDAGDSHSFTDVTDASQNDAISWMANNEITTGKSPTRFAPDDTLNRAEAATFLHRLAGKPSAPPHSFVDVVAGWQQGGVSWMADTGITTGTSPTTFAPEDTLNRAHLVTFLYRYQDEPDVTINASNPDCDPARTVVQYTIGDTIAGFPSGSAAASGNFSKASVSVTGGSSTVTITMSHNGTAAYTATTYTCTSAGGCTIVNGRVTTGTVNAATTNDTEANQAPRFTSAVTLTVPENGTVVGTVTAVDDDTADSVMGYAITGGADRSRLSITSTGRLSFDAAPDYERPADAGRDNAYQVIVTATSGAGTRTNTATHTITVTITDTAEPPSAPAAPIATSTSDTTITFTWTEPANTGPTVNDYDIQYRTSGDTAWTDWPHTGATRTATITDLTANTTYDTQVRATNPDGTSRWSTTTTVTTVETETNTPYDAASGDSLASQRFRAITAGSSHSCGLRTDGTIQCWGSNWEGKAVAPSGQFSAVTVSYNHSCGLRTDGTIQCWGSRDHLETDAPDGQFTAITAGWQHSCGLRIDNTIQCWGSNSSDAPAGAFKTVTVDKWHSCGLRIDNTIQCWGGRNGNDAPDGQFTAITAGWQHSCGLRIDNTIQCWGSNSHGQADAPDGQFTAITAGEEHSCGIQTDTSIKCWGNNSHGQADPPDGQFTAITASEEHSCGIQTDTSIKCWGNNSHGQADPPDGQFTAITAGEKHSCGIQTDASIKCWGDPDDAGLEYPSLSRVYNVRWTSIYTGYAPLVRVTWSETPQATYYQLYHCYTLSPVLDCTPRLIVSTIVGTEYRHYLTSQAVNSIIYVQYEVRACNETECSSRVAAIRD